MEQMVTISVKKLHLLEDTAFQAYQLHKDGYTYDTLKEIHLLGASTLTNWVGELDDYHKFKKGIPR